MDVYIDFLRVCHPYKGFPPGMLVATVQTPHLLIVSLGPGRHFIGTKFLKFS